jgi:hypothetical protein
MNRIYDTQHPSCSLIFTESKPAHAELIRDIFYKGKFASTYGQSDNNNSTKNEEISSHNPLLDSSSILDISTASATKLSGGGGGSYSSANINDDDYYYDRAPSTLGRGSSRYIDDAMADMEQLMKDTEFTNVNSDSFLNYDAALQNAGNNNNNPMDVSVMSVDSIDGGK